MLAWSAVLAVSKGILLYDPLQCSHLSMYINLVTYDSPCMRRKEAQTFSLGNRSASKVNLSKIDKVTHNEHKHRRPRPGSLAPFSGCTVTKLGVHTCLFRKEVPGHFRSRTFSHKDTSFSHFCTCIDLRISSDTTFRHLYGGSRFAALL